MSYRGRMVAPISPNGRNHRESTAEHSQRIAPANAGQTAARGIISDVHVPCPPSSHPLYRRMPIVEESPSEPAIAGHHFLDSATPTAARTCHSGSRLHDLKTCSKNHET